MMQISEALAQIQGAIYGYEVRQAIHDGIKRAYDDASSGGNTNMEVSMARGKHSTLNGRLDDINSLLNKLHQGLPRKIDKDSNAVTMSDLSQEVKEAISGGSVAVVGENAVGTKNLIDEAVTPEKTTFIKRTSNLFDGQYHELLVSGSLNNSAFLYINKEGTRTAIVPIQTGKTYTIKVHEPSQSDAFRVGVHSRLLSNDDFKRNSTDVLSLTELVAYNEILSEFTFMATLNGYMYVSVSKTGQEPLLQIEEGAEASEYVHGYILDKKYLPKIDIDTASSDDSKSLNELKVTVSSLESKLLPVPKLLETNYIKTDPGPRFIDFFDGKMWGYRGLDGEISTSEDGGKTWEIFDSSWNTDWGWIGRLLPTNDGEVLAMTGRSLRKSNGWGTDNCTWTESKINIHNNAVLFQFGIDGDGEKFIVAEYASSISRWPDSRYVWISTDAGDTFEVVWDSLERFGEKINAVTHLHGVAYDKWNNRFYFSEGHGPSGGLYVSLDEGQSWNQPAGYRDGVLRSGGIQGQQTERDTNGPTVLVATPDGLVMGSDNANNGLFGLVIKKDIQEEVVEHIYDANHYKPGYLSMFAIRGFYDEITGGVYVSFRSEFDDVPPLILMGTPSKGNLIYEYPKTPVTGAQDHFGAIARIDSEQIVAYAQFSGIPYTFQGSIGYKPSELTGLIRAELKKLGLV